MKMYRHKFYNKFIHIFNREKIIIQTQLKLQ